MAEPGRLRQMLRRLSALAASARARLSCSTPSEQQPDTRQEEVPGSDRLLAELEKRLTPKGLTPQLLRELGLSETTTPQPSPPPPGAGATAKTEAGPQTERGAS